MTTPRPGLRRQIVLAWLIVFGATLAPGADTPPPVKQSTAPADTPGTALLQKMEKAYAAVSSYQDDGVVLTHDSSKPSPDEIWFFTYFVRPTLFRFDWVTHHPYPPLRHLLTKAIIWRNTGSVYSYREPPSGQPSSLDEKKDLSLAVAGATGVSRQASVHVPRLLTSDINSLRLTDVKSAMLVGTETFEGVACHHISLVHARGTNYEIWIGRDDLMLRRLVRQLGGNDVEEIHRNIRLGQPIPPETFTPFEGKGTIVK